MLDGVLSSSVYIILFYQLTLVLENCRRNDFVGTWTEHLNIVGTQPLHSPRPDGRTGKKNGGHREKKNRVQKQM